jgi:hypothetical protein
MFRFLGGYFDIGESFQIQPWLIRGQDILRPAIDDSLTHDVSSMDFLRGD